MKQLALELASPPAPTLDNFVVGANAEVVAALRALARGDSRERFIYLWGGDGSGRTHLLRAVLHTLMQAGRSVRVFGAADTLETVTASDVVGVDDVHALPAPAQIELFNIFNRLKDGSGMLLVTGNMPPARLPLRADLLTRLAWGLVYEVHALSEADRLAALSDYAAARGFELPRPVADYLLAHAPRDLHTLRTLVDSLDRLSLERKRDITVPLARELLQPADSAAEPKNG
ncbi:MAG: DnaA regulatory inactivator Hda [Betaproteobacteria bacterium]|nr:DnaA regulatory inactivator Hda [Betaproteobacteria bacterium]